MRTQGMASLAWLIGAGLAASVLGAGCPKTAEASAVPITLTANKVVLEANGLDSASIVARLACGACDLSGLVVSFSATGGLLSSSAAAPVLLGDGTAEARVSLVADREEALLGRTDKPVTVRATVTRSALDVESATVDVTFVTPTTGAPSLSLTADPPAATADGSTPVTVAIVARRLAPGTVVAVTSTAGALSSDDVVLEAGDVAGSVRGQVVLTAPPAPADAVVTVREPGGVSASLTVAFVADGAAQFDLTGTFAQLSPARIRMRAGTLEPNPQCVVAPTFLKVDVVQTGDVVDATWTTCYVELASVTSIVGEVSTEAPPAFVSAIPSVRATFPLSGVALGAVFDPPPSFVVAGAELADPSDPDEELPSSEDDPRVRDSDNDGRPGVTVISSLAGEQNVTFKNTGDTRGVVRSSNHVEGNTVGDMSALPRSSVLGVGNGFIPEMESVPSVWEMVRVDGTNGSADMDTNGDGEISCQEIVDAAAFLFTIEAPPTPLDCAGVDP